MDDSVLSRTPPPFDQRLAYGADPNQFGHLRLPKGRGPHPVAMNIHGGYWRAKYDLLHAGHLCAALTRAGFATWNLEYRRVGNAGGGWPGTFEDVRNGFRFLKEKDNAQRFHLNVSKLIVLGHSAGGQLALVLAAHEPELKGAISLAGVVDLDRAYALHLSHDAVVEYLGGTPAQVPEHYREASPMRVAIPRVRQVLVHGTKDDVVPPELSRDYVKRKSKAGEHVSLHEPAGAGHFELIDPESDAWKTVEKAARGFLLTEPKSRH